MAEHWICQTLYLFPNLAFHDQPSSRFFRTNSDLHPMLSHSLIDIAIRQFSRLHRRLGYGLSKRSGAESLQETKWNDIPNGGGYRPLPRLVMTTTTPAFDRSAFFALISASILISDLPLRRLYRRQGVPIDKHRRASRIEFNGTSAQCSIYSSSPLP